MTEQTTNETERLRIPDPAMTILMVCELTAMFSEAVVGLIADYDEKDIGVPVDVIQAALGAALTNSFRVLPDEEKLSYLSTFKKRLDERVASLMSPATDRSKLS